MFIILALFSTFGYALQNALMTKFTRKWDSLSMTVYRSLSLWITMLPLLLFSKIENISFIYEYQFELILSSFCIIINIWVLYESYKYLPIWVASGLRSIGTVLTTIIISLFILNEKLNFLVIGFIFITLFWWFILSAYRNNFNHLDNSKFLKWLIFTLISGILSAIALVIMVKVSRNLDPFVSSYFWELEAWIVWVFVLFFRQKVFKKNIEKIWLKDFGKIVLASSPTFIGTMCFAIASLYWPVWIISAIWVLGIVFNIIFGIILFKEHLKIIQYFWVVLVMTGIIWIKVSM